MSDTHFDLIIVGAGALGTWHAWFALHANLRVLILEKDYRAQEATVRNFGQVVPSGFPPGEWHMHGRRTTALYRELQAQADIGIRNNGSVYIASTNEELAVLEEMQQRFADLDYPGEMLTAENVCAKYPALKTDYAKGAVFFPQEVSAEPELLIHRVQQFMLSRFAGQLQIRYRSTVLHIEDTGNRIRVGIAGGQRFSADSCIVCSGRDAKILFPEILAASGMVVSKLNMMATMPLPQVQLPGNILTGLTIRRYESCVACNAWKELSPAEVPADVKAFGIHILFKQRIDGSIIIGDSHEYAPIAQQDELGPFYNSQDINRVMLREAARILDLPDWALSEQWCGFYAQHPDEIFTHSIGPNIHIVTGIGGKGMTTGAGFAEKNLARLGILAAAAG